MRKPSLGGQELDLLRFVTEHSPIPLIQVAEQYGAPHGLARTTVHTMLERLRKKGYLVREQREGVYQYLPRVPKTELLSDLVGEFFQRTLGGSIKPFTAYLTSKSKDLSEDELQELRALVKELDNRRKEGHNE